MALVTHGTTLAGFKAIMARDGKSLEHNPWTVSDNDGQMYFYDVECVGNDYGYDIKDPEDDDTIPNAITAAANHSYEAARLQYAAKGEGGQVIVLVCDIPDHILELDYSCGSSDDMPNARAIACSDFDPEWIVDIQVADFDVWDCPAALSCLSGNSLFNWAEVPQKLRKLVESVDIECEGLYEFWLESVNVEDFIANNA